MFVREPTAPVVVGLGRGTHPAHSQKLFSEHQRVKTTFKKCRASLLGYQGYLELQGIRYLQIAENVRRYLQLVELICSYKNMPGCVGQKLHKVKSVSRKRCLLLGDTC